MRYEEKPQITEQEIREAMDFSTAQVKRNLPEFTTKFQKAYSENGFYAPTDNVDGILDGRDLAVLRGYRERHL